jgi:hypothetical protein
MLVDFVTSRAVGFLLLGLQRAETKKNILICTTAARPGRSGENKKRNFKD